MSERFVMTEDSTTAMSSSTTLLERFQSQAGSCGLSESYNLYGLGKIWNKGDLVVVYLISSNKPGRKQLDLTNARTH